MVNVDDELYKRIKPIVDSNPVEFPTIQNYINKVLKKSLDRHDQRVQMKELGAAITNSLKAPEKPQTPIILEEVQEESVHKKMAQKREKEASDKLYRVKERINKSKR
jgi:hypothetical protein